VQISVLSSAQLILRSGILLQKEWEKSTKSHRTNSAQSSWCPQAVINTALLEFFNSQISTSRRKLSSNTRGVKENKNPPQTKPWCFSHAWENPPESHLLA